MKNLIIILILFLFQACNWGYKTGNIVLADTRDVPMFLYENLRDNTGFKRTHQQVSREILRILVDSNDNWINRKIVEGNRYVLYQQFDKAETVYKMITLKDPTFSEGHNRLSKIYYKLKNYKKAKEEIDIAIALNPLHYDAFVVKGLIEKRLKNWKASLKAFQAAIKIYPKINENIQKVAIPKLKKKIKLNRA